MRDRVLGLIGPELIGTLAWPIVVAITAKLVTDAMSHAAKSRGFSRDVKVEITKEAISIVHKKGIDPKKARQIVNKIFETLDEEPDLIEESKKGDFSTRVKTI